MLFLEDTLRQLLARSRYLLFKAPGKWTDSQKRRAGILFKQFPDIKAVCYYALRLGKIFTDYIDKDVACAKNLEVGVKNRTFIMEVCCI
ncbi:transposase [Bacteroides fragilis]|uniref:Transposase n=1 Tax=Bacteroides fragilis TaxID=817 RepID=A0AAQ2S7T5_BACFG|nr:transposase [Bacteroides fragilis]MCS2670194.1 transposase [Bacteroides fragilis]MCS2741955.1 transposase [Bacteroides fragilis]MCS2927279.1 transposase [Bacteroides fragilis]MCS3275194.1 transposase [Bacteroides fragilis]